MYAASLPASAVRQGLADQRPRVAEPQSSKSAHKNPPRAELRIEEHVDQLVGDSAVRGGGQGCGQRLLQVVLGRINAAVEVDKFTPCGARLGDSQRTRDGKGASES